MNREAFTDSAGISTPSNMLQTGRLSGGVSASSTHVVSGVGALETVQPSLSLNGNWNFTDEKNFTLTTGAIIPDDNTLSLAVGAGLVMGFRGGVSGNVGVTFSGIGGDVQVFALTGGVAMPLSVFGLPEDNGGRLSLNASGAINGAFGTNALLKIPLN